MSPLRTPAITGFVSDAATGLGLNDAQVSVASDGFLETVTSRPVGNGKSAFQAAWDRAGTYDVTVSHPGYKSESKKGVVVAYGECLLLTAQLDFALQPASLP